MILCLLPLLPLVLGTAAIMLLTAWKRNHACAASLAIGSLGLATLLLPLVTLTPCRAATALLLVDNYALFFMGLTFVGTMLVAALAYGYLERRSGIREEFYMLLLTAALIVGVGRRLLHGQRQIHLQQQHRNQSRPASPCVYLRIIH